MSSSFPPDSNEPPETDRYFVPPDPPLDPPSDGVDGGIDSSPMLESSGESLFPMTRPRPRAWTAIAIVVISLLVFIVASGVMAFAAFLIVHGKPSAAMFADPNAVGKVLASRIGLFVMVVTPQLILVLPAVVAGFLSPVETRTRLGLVRGNWPMWTWLAAAAATPLVGLISSVFVGQFMAESESLKMMSDVFRSHGKSGFLIPLALMIGATPAICEELLFRGYVQTRLVKSIGPAFGIVISSVLFAAFHMDFVHVIAVLPLGFFLGWVSWRSASLFPAMIGHFVNNVISVVALVFAPEDQADVLVLPTMIVSLTIIGMGMIGIVVVIAASVLYGHPESNVSIVNSDQA